MSNQNNGAARYMQGIAVPASSVNPREFFARTRRRVQTEKVATFAGLGGQDIVEIKKTGIISGFYVRLVGDVTSTPGAGTVATTRRWPYDLIKQLKFTANGQSNLINVSGAKLKAREFMALGDLSDRGVSQVIGASTATHGTLSQSCESWGVGSAQTAIGAGTFDLDLSWFVPVAEDQVDLAGAIFAATSSTDLTVSIDWATKAELFALTGNADASVSATLQVVALRYDVPLGADGQIVVPDLSVFHSMIQSRHTSLANGENELRLVGQGAGKTLLRAYSQVWNGAGVGAPLVVDQDNFGKLAWRYSGNETPDEYVDGQILRYINEKHYNVDLGAVHGFFCHDFAVENAFRDVVDLGTTSEWRQLVTIPSGVVLTNAALEVVTETIFSAGAGS